MFTLKFLDQLSRHDVEGVEELRFLDGEIHVPDPAHSWRALASLVSQCYYKDEFDGEFDFHYKIIRVSEGQAGKGRFQLDGVDGAGARSVIWDDIESVQGSRSGLYVYARGRGRGFYLDWVDEERGFRYRDGRLGEPRPEREGPRYVELRLARFRQPAQPRQRVSVLAD